MPRTQRVTIGNVDARVEGVIQRIMKAKGCSRSEAGNILISHGALALTDKLKAKRGGEA